MRSLLLTTLAICVSSSVHAEVMKAAPLPADAVGAIYTTIPIEQVATCIANAAGVSAERRNGSLMVIGTGNTFEVLKETKSPVYITVVIVRGATNQTKIGDAAILCSAISLPQT